MAGLTGLTMLLVKTIPKLTTVVPPSLGAVGVVALLSKLLSLPATTLVDIAGEATFAGGVQILPKLAVPALGPLLASPLATLGIIAPCACRAAREHA